RSVGSRRLRKGKPQDHCRSTGRWTGDGYGPAMRLDEAFRRGEAKPGTTSLGGEKRCEQLFAHIARNARTHARDGNHAAAGIYRHLDLDCTASVHRMGAVEEKVLGNDLQ